MNFTDSHCHLDFPEFNIDREAVIEKCRRLGIHRLIIPGVEQPSWQNLLQLANQSPSLFPTLGIHPWYIENALPEHLTALENALSEPANNVVAVGEIGIDGALKHHVENVETNLAKQVDFFTQQLHFANKFQLPVIVHHRKSHHLITPLLKQVSFAQGGIIHGFSGSYQQAVEYIDLGFKLGIGGTITYERAKKTRNALKRLPITSFVLETDAPAMPLFGFQGQRNEPSQLLTVFKVLAELLSLEEQQLATQLENNIEQVFFTKVN